MQKPTKEKIFISQIQREVTLNFITLADDEWMRDKFGVDKLTAAFTGETLDLNVILAIFYRVLNKEDKDVIVKVKIHEDTALGEIKELEFDDPVKKLKHIISGQKEITDIIIALTNTRIKSNPEVVEMLKKKLVAKQPVPLDGDTPRI